MNSLGAPLISVIVIFYNMRREAQRTLLSMSSAYQQGIDSSEYEIIAIDNASSAPLDARMVESFGENFRYHYFNIDSPSPVAAINYAAQKARGKFLGIFIDGARILSPGVLQYTKAACGAFPNPIVSTLGWHLGPELQCLSIAKGYNKDREDELLDSISWPDDGYRLFDISAFAWSSRQGFFLPINESNGCFVSAALFESLGGFDEAFDLPGGGLVNLDFYNRAVSASNTQLVILLGEGTFHQIHGGIMTNSSLEENNIRWKEFDAQYRRLRGTWFEPVKRDAIYLGTAPPASLRFIKFSAQNAIDITGV